MSMDFSEVNKLAVDLGGAAARIGVQAAVVLRKTAKDIESDAKALAPVDTGNLKGSITTSFEGDGRGSSMSAEIGPTAEYGIYQEYGTSTQAGTPFMGPAFDRRAPGMETAMAALAAKLLDS